MLPQRNWRDLIKPENLEAEDKNLTPTYGKFAAEPLERGFGTTIGNALRRVLLSSLQGAAVTSVKIEGVLHEFATLPGVREDVTDIVLNLKDVRVKLHEGAEAHAHLKAKGERTIRAGDIQAGPNVEILNPDLEIANLSKDGSIDAELTIRIGRGYVPADRTRKRTRDRDHPDRCDLPGSARSTNGQQRAVGQRTDYDTSCR
jgi:DNA-directed RNA polymerase subunit alpha